MSEAQTHWRALRDVVVRGVPFKAGDTFKAPEESIDPMALVHGMVERVTVKGKKTSEELPP
jgi:predicted amidohydrolase YtcJ